ncbi:GntR family transcriptional regulator [Alcaligenaceae bacterium CGII-47]|nr:GntR family transcriptional regulator [Alcaligenaceae bacterium CGII-47]
MATLQKKPQENRVQPDAIGASGMTVIAVANQRQLTLARQIIKLAYAQGWSVGHHIMEEKLSAQLGVSRSPIRAILRLLAEYGIVELQPNRGCFLLVSGAALDDVKLQAPPTHADHLYSLMIEDRLSGSLPQRFTQTEAMRHYGVARPLLERVLRRLAYDGLIARNDGQGWSFSQTLDSQQSRNESYAFRLLLEPGAILMHTFQPDKHILQRLRKQHLLLIEQIKDHVLDNALAYETDVDFHRSIAAFTSNSFVIDAMEQHNRLRHLLEFSSYSNKARVINWCQEHLGIIAALETGNYKKASTLMREHILEASDSGLIRL